MARPSNNNNHNYYYYDDYYFTTDTIHYLTTYAVCPSSCCELGLPRVCRDASATSPIF